MAMLNNQLVYIPNSHDSNPIYFGEHKQNIIQLANGYNPSIHLVS